MILLPHKNDLVGKSMYVPPFEITSKIIELISKISEKLGEITSIQNNPCHIQLRK